MHAWEAIQKAVDYIENHLAEDLTTEALSAEAALSPFYFQRLFARLVGRPLHEYIRLRRLARAGEALASSDRRILDIALDGGFTSHEALTRAFKEVYGMTPESYRRAPVRLNHFGKPDLLLGYVTAEEDVPLISEGIVIEVTRRTLPEDEHYLGFAAEIPIAAQFPVGEATGVDLPGAVWERFHRTADAIPGWDLQAPAVGVAYEVARAGHFGYFAGSRVAPGMAVDGLDSFTLPAGAYIVCGFEAESFERLVTEAIDKANRYMGLWLRRHGEPVYHWACERYDDPSPQATAMEIWLKTTPL